MHGNRDSDFLTVSSGLARGGQGDDTLVGGGVLIGNFGADLLEGSLGAPTVFVLRSDTETGTQLEAADLMDSFRPTAGHRIAVAGDFSVADLTFDVATVVSTFNRRRTLTAADGLADVLIRRTSTGQLLGVVVNFGDANVVRSLTEVVPFTDPALQLG